MHLSMHSSLLMGAAIALLAGCAAPVGESLTCSAPVATVETEPEIHYTEYPQPYYGMNPPRQFLRGGTGSTPLRYKLRVAGPAAVGERLADHPATLPGGQERLVATETWGYWQ